MERHDEQQQEKPHKRRIHYSGRYPRHFAEKYKELNPEKYGEEIAHARANCAARRLDKVSPFMGSEVSLRWIYTHMIAEYARHCGHADIVRERIDGATGV